ncbi:MAG: FecR family protein [Flavobacteriales bacterium]
MENKKLLSKWLNNEINSEELKKLTASKEYASYIKIAKATAKLSPPVFNSTVNFDAINSKIKQQKSVKVRTFLPLKTVIQIAAIFAILFASYVFVSNLDTTISTKIAEKETFLLPDESQVVLNANSSIRYQKNSWNNNRELNLDGEAYFKVKKGKKFSVKTSNGVVQVLGTHFNVFSRENFFYIKCFEGLVSVSFNDTLIKLPAKNTLQIEQGVVLAHSKINSENPSWIDNESYFKNTTLALVLQEIERQYPVTINTKNINVSTRFSGTVTHTDLSLALQAVCEPLNLDFSINNNDEVTIYAKSSKK